MAPGTPGRNILARYHDRLAEYMVEDRVVHLIQMIQDDIHADDVQEVVEADAIAQNLAWIAYLQVLNGVIAVRLGEEQEDAGDESGEDAGDEQDDAVADDR